jgi:hypothetical protein
MIAHNGKLKVVNAVVVEIEIGIPDGKNLVRGRVDNFRFRWQSQSQQADSGRSCGNGIRVEVAENTIWKVSKLAGSRRLLHKILLESTGVLVVSPQGVLRPVVGLLFVEAGRI